LRASKIWFDGNGVLPSADPDQRGLDDTGTRHDLDFVEWRVTIACNGAGGRVGFEINASRAGPLMRNVHHS
ncbi:MAG: hypothetical protein SFV81_28595, partial [Pirellulaceae bacterium]|nr:hypothetical protein [Pirellulaceae bacterium]